jgi:hypothetical protein
MQEVFKRNIIDKKALEKKLLTSNIIMIDEYKTLHTLTRFKCTTCKHEWKGRVDAVRNYVACPKCRESKYNTSPLNEVPKEDRGYVKVKINLIKAIKLKGGKCKECGEDILSKPWLYDFHHIDPSTKSNEINSLIYSNWEKLKNELDKCVLLCSHCHRKIHFDKDRYELYKQFIDEKTS